MSFTSFALLLATLLLPVGALEPPVVLDAPVEFQPQSAGSSEPEILYLAQPAKDGRIDLTATNGFFDRCFLAAGPGETLPGDEGLIRGSFDHLRKSGDGTGTARWHLWFDQPGAVHATIHFTVPENEREHPWTFRLGNESHTATAIDGGKARTLRFSIAAAGKQSFAIDCSETPPPPGTRIHFITLEGPAIEHARLLRTRWRPAAVHQRFEAPDACTAPDLWVFETRSVSESSSYSPLTTPFGYYGTSFKAGGGIAPGASFNFSMWLASRDEPKAPPIEKMPRILATGLPDAEFSWFSHEGTGVKLREAVAYPDGAERTIQALRAEFADGLWTYYGYFYDEAASEWRLFAAGRQPPKRGRAPDASRGLLRSTGSFCEIPGPPARERSGDVVRLIERRGWFIDRDGTPHLARMARGRGKPSPPDSQRTWYRRSYPDQGWMAMATGGMERYPSDPAAAPPAASVPLPEYLAPDKLRQLHELPVEFGPSRIVELSPTSATVEIPLTKLGPKARARLHYGPIDALTYPAVEITRGSAALRDMFRPERTWAHQTDFVAIEKNVARFKLTDLEPDSTYHFRLFVAHDRGQSWNFSSSSFQTPAP